MSESGEANKPDFEKTYAETKPKILDGSITKKEASKLYDACSDMKKAELDTKVFNDLKKDGMNSEKLHNFVSKLVDVEMDKVTQKYPRLKARRDQYMRNTNLAKTAMLYECVENRLGVEDIYPAIKDVKINRDEMQELRDFQRERSNLSSKEDNKKKNDFVKLSGGKMGKAAKAFDDFKVPDYLQDHFSKLKPFYQKNSETKLESEAVANVLVFHALQTSVNQHSLKNDSPQQYAQNMKVSEQAAKLAFDKSKEGSYDKILNQIPPADQKVKVDFEKMDKVVNQKPFKKAEIPQKKSQKTQEPETKPKKKSAIHKAQPSVSKVIPDKLKKIAKNIKTQLLKSKTVPEKGSVKTVAPSKPQIGSQRVGR
ncbi:MAG: hypothetical protein DGJ47_000662 [Rickettsiaceae bacterium]